MGTSQTVLLLIMGISFALLCFWLFRETISRTGFLMARAISNLSPSVLWLISFYFWLCLTSVVASSERADVWFCALFLLFAAVSITVYEELMHEENSVSYAHHKEIRQRFIKHKRQAIRRLLLRRKSRLKEAL